MRDESGKGFSRGVPDDKLKRLRSVLTLQAGRIVHQTL